MKDAMALFAGPHPLYGGVVVGEAYRVDHDKVADVRFDPDRRSTWGRGGTAPMLIDPVQPMRRTARSSPAAADIKRPRSQFRRSPSGPARPSYSIRHVKWRR